jgi:hypothetical protein
MQFKTRLDPGGAARTPVRQALAREAARERVVRARRHEYSDRDRWWVKPETYHDIDDPGV